MKKLIVAPVALLGLLSLTSCLDYLRGPSRQPGSALWVAAGDGQLSSRDLARMEAAAIGEIFVEAATLSWDRGEPRLESEKELDLPRRSAVTLVVSGSWPRVRMDPDAAAKRLTQELRRLKIESESRGLVPVGFHFDLDTVVNLDSYTEVLEEVADEIERPLLVSATLQRRWLTDPAVSSLADAVHFVVVFAYGQRPNEVEDSTAWDLKEATALVQRLEGLGQEYLVGINTLGSVAHHDRDGGRREVSTEIAIRELLSNPSLKVASGFSFQGIDRQAYDLRSQRSTQVKDWQLRSGDTLHVVRPATPYVEQLLARIESLELDRHLGQVYYRLRQPQERLSLSLDSILQAVAPGSATPELSLELEPIRQTRSLWTFRVQLHSRNDEYTELSFVESNYVELQAEGGVFGGVDLGDFQRFVLLRRDSEGVTMRAIREPDILQLYVPIVEGGVSVASGQIELRVRSREPRLTLSGHFLLPDGRTLNLPVKPWPPLEEEP